MLKPQIRYLCDRWWWWWLIWVGGLGDADAIGRWLVRRGGVGYGGGRSIRGWLGGWVDGWRGSGRQAATVDRMTGFGGITGAYTPPPTPTHTIPPCFIIIDTRTQPLYVYVTPLPCSNAYQKHTHHERS